MMKINKLVYVGLVGALAATIVGATLTGASATETNGGNQPVYLVNPDTGSVKTAGSTLNFATSVVASPNPAGTSNSVTGTNELFIGPSDATGVFTFVAPLGSENTKSSWSAYNQTGFVSGTKNTWLPSMSLNAQIGGNITGVKNAGGDYSLGIAFTKDAGVTIIAGYTSFTQIRVTASTGDWTFVTPTPYVAPAPPSGSFNQGMSVTTAQAVDGALNLVSPSSATTTFGTAVLNSVTKLSTSTATLGNFSVQDDRIVSHPGWTLTSTVADFVSGSNTISKAQLGMVPKVVTGNGAGAVVGTTQVAGSATYPSTFASAVNYATVGTTVLGADLTFVAPASAAVGTYTSTLTITLASR
ncbi:MAG: hypothetical protein H7201_05625 [Candidatus Saccharibacteria bacterium]|nr:hypothetical protein [Microbacteriaceae bacterium]